MPAWLTSFLVHLALILALAVIPLIDEIAPPFVIVGSFGSDPIDQPFEIADMSTQALENSPISIATPEAASSVQVDPLPLEVLEVPELGVGLTQPKIEIALNGRRGPLKSSLLAAYGGTAGTEQAVREGLRWLVKQQRTDGSWSLRGPYSDGGIAENKCAATAMALIALAGDGNTPREGEYQSAVDRGLKYLLKLQDNEGFFAVDAPERHQTYAQAQATIALCEIYGMTTDATLRKPAQLALDYAERAQGTEGGWRYYPREDSDTSVTGWYVMALMSGQMAGLSTSRRVLERVDRYLDLVQLDGGSQYVYSPLSNRSPSYSMTAEGLLCREYLGWPRSDPRLIRGCEQLIEQPISTDARERSYYYWYYATQTLHHFGGQAWYRWNEAMKVNLPQLQLREGKEKGSWPPQGDDHASAGGRLYSTCFSIYCLEVYYRHLPLYGFSR